MRNLIKQKNIILALTLLLVFPLLWACKHSESFREEDDVRFILPKWPPEYGDKTLYPELLAWQITTNEVRNQLVKPDVQEIKVSIPKNKPFYLMAQPVTKVAQTQLQQPQSQTQAQSQCTFFHCAGGIYPYCYERSGKNGTVKVSWEQGFSAYLMDSMFLSANSFYGSSDSKSVNDSEKSEYENYLASFNWKKFSETIQAKTTIDPNAEAQKAFYNPWHTDLPAIKQGIAYKNFSATLLNQKNCFSVVLENYCTNKGVLSSYIPENEIIHNFSRFSLKKNEENYYSVNNQYQMIIRGSSAKNLSIEYIFLPIIR